MTCYIEPHFQDDTSIVERLMALEDTGLWVQGEGAQLVEVRHPERHLERNDPDAITDPDRQGLWYDTDQQVWVYRGINHAYIEQIVSEIESSADSIETDNLPDIAMVDEVPSFPLDIEEYDSIVEIDPSWSAHRDDQCQRRAVFSSSEDANFQPGDTFKIRLGGLDEHKTLQFSYYFFTSHVVTRNDGSGYAVGHLDPSAALKRMVSESNMSSRWNGRHAVDRMGRYLTHDDRLTEPERKMTMDRFKARMAALFDDSEEEPDLKRG